MRSVKTNYIARKVIHSRTVWNKKKIIFRGYEISSSKVLILIFPTLSTQKMLISHANARTDRLWLTRVFTLGGTHALTQSWIPIQPLPVAVFWWVFFPCKHNVTNNLLQNPSLLHRVPDLHRFNGPLLQAFPGRSSGREQKNADTSVKTITLFRQFSKITGQYFLHRRIGNVWMSPII